VRYWIDGVDEDYERELEHVSRFGGAPPAPLSLSSLAGLIFLVAIQLVLCSSLFIALVLR
jgi:hypothetical protein